MGSFYTTCSISNLTITKQKTSIILLTPSYSMSYEGHRGMVLNEGCGTFFAPFGFPIRGEYYDYGYLENIEYDKNVEMLEDFFNLSIHDIIKNIGDDRWYTYGEKEGDSSYKLKTKDGGEIRNQEIFLKLGMTYIRTEVLEFMETRWDKIKRDEDRPYSFGSRVYDFLDELKDKEEGLTEDEIHEALKADGLTDEDRKALIKQLFNTMGFNKSNHSYIPSLVKYNMFELLPITYEFKDEILKQYMFTNKLGNQLKRPLVPSNYGSQYNNWNYIHKLNTLVNSLAEADMDEEFEVIKEWFIDDEGELDVEGFLEAYPTYKDKLNQ